jgi:aspartate/methionine/tyrosine aminotransferase
MFTRRTGWNLATNRCTEAIHRHRQTGRELLDLTASNPTSIGLRYDDKYLLGALSKPESLAYLPMSKGLLAPREGIAAYYAELGATVDVESLVLTTSTSEAYTFCFRLLCEPGDEVLVPTPSYPLFEFLAELQDMKLVPYPLIYDHGWQIDFHSLEQRITPRSRAVIVVHPNNPTGSYVKPREARMLSRICTEREMAIIADEVFLDYGVKNAGKSFATNETCLTFTMSGLSKISALPQMKVAWLIVSGPAELRMEAVDRLEVIADTYLSMNAPIQHAVPEFLEARRSVQQQLLARVRENLAELDRQLAGQTMVSRLEIEGGWQAVLRVPATRTDEELAIALIWHKDVLVQPGHFYDFHRDGYLVVSLITPSEEFAKGMARVVEFVR